MFCKFFPKSFLIIVVFFQIFSAKAFSTGACCSVSKGDLKKPTFSLAFSSAWSHEKFSEETYNLTQQALNLKAGYPFMERFFLQAHAGLPVRSKLSHHDSEMRGNLGIIYGASIGYVFPEFLEQVELFASFSITRSHGFLKKMETVEKIKKTILISELQGILLAEFDPVEKISLYSGMRLYYGKNKLIDDQTKSEISGDREGNISPLIGVRYSLLENLGLVAEAGLGHTRVLSLGTLFTF